MTAYGGLPILRGHLQPARRCSDEAMAGARVIVNLAASHYHEGRASARDGMIAQRARDELTCRRVRAALVGARTSCLTTGLGDRGPT